MSVGRLQASATAPPYPGLPSLPPLAAVPIALEAAHPQCRRGHCAAPSSYGILAELHYLAQVLSGTGWGFSSLCGKSEIEGPSDLAVPQTPANPIDDCNEIRPRLAIVRGGVRPVFGRLINMLNPHRKLEPIKHMMSWARTSRFCSLLGINASHHGDAFRRNPRDEVTR